MVEPLNGESQLYTRWRETCKLGPYFCGICWCFLLSELIPTLWNMLAVHALQVEIGELKGRLTEVISNCDALCKRIAAEGPESLRASIKPFAAATSDLETSFRSSSVQRVLDASQPTTETKPNWFPLFHSCLYSRVFKLIDALVFLHCYLSAIWSFQFIQLARLSSGGASFPHMIAKMNMSVIF